MSHNFWTTLLAILIATESQAAPRVIGAMAELSGATVSYGEQCRKGYDIARYELLGEASSDKDQNIKLLVGDNQGQPVAGLNEFKRLTEIEKAIAVITTRSPVAMSISPVSQKMGIPLLATVGYGEFVSQNPFAFRFWPSANQMGKYAAEWMHELSFKRVAVLSLEDEFNSSFAEIFNAELVRSGSQIVFDQTVNEGERDFSALVSKIGQAKPDLIFVNLNMVQIGIAIRKIREQKLSQPLLTSNWAAYPAVVESAGATAMEGTMFADFDFTNPRFTTLFEKRFPSEQPMAMTYACYSALATLIKTLQDEPSIQTSEQLNNKLTTTDKVSLPDGELTIRSREAFFRLVKKTFVSGKIVNFQR